MAADRTADGPAPDRRDPVPRRDTEPLPDVEPVLPEVTEDEGDLGWGDDRDSGRRDEEWYRRERPPHHE